jgi:1,4-dihydroxy-2-naphthoate octaprenyltransferase
MADNESHTASENVTGRHGRLGRRFETRSVLLAVVLAVVWIEVLLDPQAAWLVLILLGGLGIALGLMGAAMGLGFLGFGLCMAGDRVMGWLRRASQWPDE